MNLKNLLFLNLRVPRLFQNFGATTKNALSSQVQVKDLGTAKRLRALERRERLGT